MDGTLETAAVADLAAEASVVETTVTPAHTHADCLNCGARLHGRYCHDCGQSADDHHRSIGHLLWEAVEGFTHFDGRLAQTLPALLLRPGRLARDHIEGRRQRHVPPFRLFLICLLAFMFAAEFAVGHGHRSGMSMQGGPHDRQAHQAGLHTALTNADMAEMRRDVKGSEPVRVIVDWMTEHVGRATQNREYFSMLAFQWAHRLAALMLPILAALLTLMYVYKRQFYIYDHLVVSMQYLAFCFLVWGVVLVLPQPVKGIVFLPAIVWTPFNLYLILRTAYGSRRIGAAAKALVLWSSTVLAFTLLLVGLLAYVLNAM